MNDAMSSEVPSASNVTSTTNPASVKSKANIISFVILLLILLAVPVTVIYLGNQTRQEIKAASECRTPPIPDPSDCVRGQWKLYKDTNGCIHFRCEIK